MASAATLDDFLFYEVPGELVAQKPAVPAESARLMVLRKEAGTVEHFFVRDLPDILDDSYIVLVNNTKVVDCKLTGRWVTGREEKADDAKHVQVLYVLSTVDEPGLLKCPVEVWSKLKCAAEESGWSVYQISGEGLAEVPLHSEVRFVSKQSSEVVTGTLLQHVSDGSCDAIMSFDCDGGVLNDLYEVPLPPYINSAESKAYEERYQTIFAKDSDDTSLGLGAVAAPTAGLHFTPHIKQRLEKEKGVEIVETTLHVGYGTFAHVHVKELRDHKMHAEAFCMSADTASKLMAAKNRQNKKILTVGTTSTRTLESVSTRTPAGDGEPEQGPLQVVATRGTTNIFIHPGYEWQATDALLTNFHVPGLTPIMLVSAFAGHDLTQRAYKEALERKYRFFSFGDAMLILP